MKWVLGLRVRIMSIFHKVAIYGLLLLSSMAGFGYAEDLNFDHEVLEAINRANFKANYKGPSNADE